MRRKLALSLALLLVFAVHHPLRVSAQTATSAAATSSPSATTQKLRERIEKVVEEKREQIAGVLDEITGQRRGYIGEIQRVTSETMTLRTLRGTRIVSIKPTITLQKGTETIKIDQVAVGDWAIVIGSLEDDEIQPDKIIISSTSLRPKPQVVTVGSITKITPTSLSLTDRATGEEYQFTLTKTAKLQDFTGTTIKSTQISPEMQAVVVGQRPTETTLNALIVRVLVTNPQPVTPQPTPRTSSRPTTSPRPNASPTVR